MAVEGFERNELLRLSWGRPVMAQIELTRNCNQRCIFCFRSCCPEILYENLNAFQWKAIVVKLKKLGVRRLNFSGGENFLHPDFAEIVAFSKSKGFEIVINTNGCFSCKDITPYSDEIIFSIHGLGKVHDGITGIVGSFELAECHLAEVAGNVKLLVNMVLVRANYSQMNAVFSHFDKRYGLYKFSPTISIKSLFGFSHAAQALEVTKDLIDDYKRRLAEIPQAKLELKHGFQSIYFGNPSLYTSPFFPLPNCAGGKYKLVIDYNGDVYPCNFFKSEDFCCGNILDGDEAEIWTNGKGFQRFRAMILQDDVPQKCQACLKKARCASGCRAWSEQYQKGGFENAADFRCEIGNAFIRG